MAVVFTGWDRSVAMRFCRLGRAYSLPEICGGLACCEGELKHLSVPPRPHVFIIAPPQRLRSPGIGAQ